MGRLRPIEWGAIAIAAVLYAALAYLSVALTRGDGGFALLWLPGGFLIGWLLRMRGAMAVPAILACMMAHIPVVWLLGDTFYHAVGRAAAHAIDAGLTLAFLRAGLGARPDMAVPRSHLWLIGSVSAAVAVGATVVSVFVLGKPGTFELDLFALWYAHNVLSLLLILPVTMIMIDLWRDRGNWNAADFHRAAISVAVVAVGTALVFWQNTIPLLFLISPLLLFAAFRSGLVGSAFAIIAVTVIATAATWLGHGPIQLVRGGRETQALALQIFLVASFLMCIPLAAVLQERDRVRLAAAAARDEIREIVDNVRDIIFRTDAAGRWTALNHAWEEVTGYTVAESLGTPTTTLLHPDDHAEAARLYPRLAAGEVDELLLEQHFIARNGKVRNIVVKVRRVVDAAGTFAGTVGNIADVTEMAERTRALARSEENFRLIAQNTPVGLFRANPDGHLTYMSPNWMERLGRKPAELMGDGWLKALADASMFMNQPMWLNFQPGEVRRRRIPFNGVDGKIVWMDIYTSAGFDENGNVIEYNGAAVDITEQRHALERLAESEEQLRLITDNVTDSVLRLGLDGVCRYASPSVERLFELPAKALVGHVVLTDFHPDDEAAVKAAFARLTTGESDSEVVAFRSRSPVDRARYRWMEASCALIRDENGQPKEVLASLRDVSRNKALEAELRAAQERAEAATTAKSAFLANMSHELRTPMNGVIGYTNLLAETDLDAKQREQVEAISESSQSMMTLLNDILDLSKIEAGQMEIVNEPVDLPHKLRGAVRLVDSVARAKGIALETDIDPALPRWIAGDPLRLRQIVLNLVGNAVKFTQRGGVNVNARRAEDGKTFTIAVKDSGIGIAPENVEAIFEQFAQGDNTIARRFGGTGLGLSICSRLAAMMGGGIAVKSELGKGSTFTLTLPLEPALPPSGVVQGSNGAAPGAEEQISDAHVLVVEDNAINRGLIAAILGGVGIKPAMATNGREAIEAVEAADSAGAPYNLVLMDVQMPEIDGLAATRHLRANGFSPAKLPIVALTANAFAEDIAQCRAAGMQAHLAKPIVKADLYAAIARHRIPSDKTRAVSSGDEPDRDLGEIYAALRADLLAALVAARGDDAPDTAELQELAHQIAGTAAVFGEPELGEAAAHLDKALRDAASVTDRKAAVAQWDSRITEAAGA